MWKEMTRTHPNQSLDTLIFLIILNSIWQFAAFPYIQAVRKAVKHQNKNLYSKSAPLIPTESTSAFHSTNLFLFSCHHIPTNGVAPLSAYKPTTPPIALTKGQRSKRKLFYPLRWLIYVFNSVVNTKLPAILSHRCSTTVSLETYPFIQNNQPGKWKTCGIYTMFEMPCPQ